tara:strand:- start:11717 stop:11938 length:222 start_codon:yes stop_codon:yes gene_type:complete
MKTPNKDRRTGFTQVNYIYLESVGTFIDPKTCITYAANNDETPDLDSAMRINQVSNEWISSLSSEDYEIVVNL